MKKHSYGNENTYYGIREKNLTTGVAGAKVPV
jgi:hypothetical protein